MCVCVGYVCGATATAIDGLVGDKVGWPRRGVRGRLAVGSGSFAQQLHARARTEPIGVSKAGSSGVFWGLSGWVGFGVLWLGCVDVSLALRRPI